MRNATYKELCDERLEELIGLGGDVGTIVTMVNMYQETDTIARHCEFENWVDGTSFACQRCNRAFSPDPQAVEEEDYVICSKCTRQYATAY